MNRPRQRPARPVEQERPAPAPVRPRPPIGRYVRTTLVDATGDTSVRRVHLVGGQDEGMAVAEHLAVIRFSKGRTRLPITLTIEAVDADGNPTEDHR